MDFDVALYPTVTDTHPQLATFSLAELTSKLTTHVAFKAKGHVPMYGPYLLHHTLPFPCPNPKHEDRARVPHRCDHAVATMTLAVFDVDVGTPDQVRACQDLLRESGLAHIWHTSYSHRDDNAVASWRLVLPLSKPMDPANWPDFRKHLLSRFQIPADPVKCKGRSHCWYFPSHPPEAEDHAHAYAVEGVFLEPIGNKRTRPAPPPKVEFVPPPEVASPVDMAPLRELIAERARSLAHMSDPNRKRAGLWLKNALEGRELAEHGSRNEATKSVTMQLVRLLDGQPVSVIRHLCRPSVEAMVRAGSTMTYEELDRMILGAMRWWAGRKAEMDARKQEEAETVARLREWLDGFGNETKNENASTPTLPEA